MTKTFREFLLELDYKGRDDISTDAKLVHMALKKHFRNPENFKKLLATKAEDKDAGGKFTHFHVSLNDLPVHDDIKKKYPNTTLHFGPPRHVQMPDGVGQVYGNVKQKKTMLGLGKTEIHHYNLKFNSLHRNFEKQPDDYRHQKFKDELNKSFDSHYHEWVHVHQYQHPDKHVDVSGLNKGYSNEKDYLNSPHEFDAHEAEHFYHIEKAIRTNPDLRKKLHSIKSPKMRMAAISHHTGHDHDVWYDKLHDDHQAVVATGVDSILRKYRSRDNASSTS